MNTPPREIGEAQIRRALRQWWGFAAVSLEYCAVGFGSHHWLATDVAGNRRFVTVYDLTPDDEEDDTDADFEELERAFSAAALLRDRAGLRFVVAPLASEAGAVLHRLGRHFSIALFPFVEGSSSPFGEHPSAEARAAVLALLVELHAASAHVVDVAGSEDFALLSRRSLERALSDLGRPWKGGPYAEPARRLLHEHEASVKRRLERYDTLRGGVAAERARWVVTHGEPHAANVIWCAEGPLLVDWDTLLVGPPERDLWMVLGADGSERGTYEAATGTTIEPDVLELYRLWWDLSEIGTYVGEFRRPHEEDADTAVAWRGLQESAAR